MGKIKLHKLKGVALVATTTAMIAWMLLAYGIFTVQSSQFQMLISNRDSVNAQKLAEIDAELIKLLSYDQISNNSAFAELNLHTNRGTIQTVKLDGADSNWQDEIIISDAGGGVKIATINIYKDGDTIPRSSLQIPILKSGQTYSKKAFDEFIEELKAKDVELEAKDRELEAKDRELEAKDNELAAKIQAARQELLDAVENARCKCAEGIKGS